MSSNVKGTKTAGGARVLHSFAAGGPPYHFCFRVPHSTEREAEVGWGFSVESSEIGVEVNYPTLARPTITPCSSARARMGHPIMFSLFKLFGRATRRGTLSVFAAPHLPTEGKCGPPGPS